MEKVLTYWQTVSLNLQVIKWISNKVLYSLGDGSSFPINTYAYDTLGGADEFEE
jgi:hypothetical protein